MQIIRKGVVVVVCCRFPLQFLLFECQNHEFLMIQKPNAKHAYRWILTLHFCTYALFTICMLMNFLKRVPYHVQCILYLVITGRVYMDKKKSKFDENL